MRYRKKQQVIVQLEAFGEVVASTKDTVTVKIGKMEWRVKKDKVRPINAEEEANAINLGARE